MANRLWRHENKTQAAVVTYTCKSFEITKCQTPGPVVLETIATYSEFPQK